MTQRTICGKITPSLPAPSPVKIGFFPWRFADGESSIGRCIAFVDNDEYEELMARKAQLPRTRFGDAYNPEHVAKINNLSERR